MKTTKLNPKPKRKANRRFAAAHGSAWRRLKWNETIKAKDRVLYAGGVISETTVPNFEVGMTVRNSGYFGIVRKVATPNDES